MMAHSVSFIVLVAALLINTLSYCSADNVYCVTPTAASCSSCPHNSSHNATLSEYAQEAELYFTSNTTMVFLPGDHTLDMNITVANVARLTILRESSSDNIATVVRNGSVGFSFKNVVDFNIYSMAFTSYNMSWDYDANSALLLNSSQNAKLINCSFHGNLGTALTVHNTSITLAENSKFTHNQCGCKSLNCELGCGITAINSNLTFIGNTNFLRNSKKRHTIGVHSAIHITENAVLTFNGTNNFINNSGNAIYTSHNTVLNFIGTSNFIGNHETGYNSGSAIYALWNAVLIFNGTNNFINNSANSGGAIFAATNISLTFIGSSNFSNNSAYSNGGAISATTNIFLSFTGTSNFSRNSAMLGGAISAISNSTLTFNGTNSFTNNGHTTNEFNINNGVSCGGAMYLAISSFFSIFNHTTVHWENNHSELGGAICVSDSTYCTRVVQSRNKKCFVQLSRPGQNLSGSQLVLKNNYADFGGNVLYGGDCELNVVSTYSSGEVFDMLIINNDPDNNTTSKISSDPIKICPCEKNHQNCGGLPQHHAYLNPVFPGETFKISVVAVGQRNRGLSSTVRSTAITNSIDSHPANLLDYQYLQQTNNTCTELEYTVFSLSQEVTIKLHPEGSPCYYNGKPQYWHVTLNQTCPPGFNISESARSCVCDPRLAHYTNQCNITNGLGQITRESDDMFWVGYDSSSHELILHPQCPFDYCVSETVVFPLNNTDIQCAHNRSGLLCGRCKEGYSLVLGTHHCSKCTNTHLVLLIPFAVMGVALVFLLLVCKLTVATGTLSGLVFYANIVGPNRTLFLPAGSTNAFSVFIAWLNLDFGIETCFYNGLDAYNKTWLQFVFPVYIWVLVVLMIFVSHYSQRFTNILGSNPVSVLATLILLSYTKVLRTLISEGSYADLDYPDNSTRRVWLHDANIGYVYGKNIPLFLMALFFLLFFLLYTLLLFFGQCLQAISHLKLFSWVNSARLKPFMDSYHAPYKPKHRYWPGLLLVLRFVLTLVFAFNDPSTNLLAIVVGAGILQLWAWVSGGVYKNWCLDALEGSFALNLTILGAATYYVDHINGNKLAVWYTSVAIALVTFIAILAYHMFQQLRHTKLWKKVPKLNLEFKKLNTKQAEDNLNNLMNDPNVADFDQLREPLLEDLLPPTHSVV